MIVNHEHKFIFLRTEKTAGTSLTEALARLARPGDLVLRGAPPTWAAYSPVHIGALRHAAPELFGLHVHASARQARRVLGPKIFDNYLKFAIERNPWERQVSLYAHRQWKTGRPMNFDRDMRSLWYRNTEYCKLDNWSIYAIDGEIIVDRMLRYETLKADIAALFAELGLAPPEMGRRRAYAPDRPHYATYYSDATRDLVGRWYAREIDALGYSFETPPAPARAAPPENGAQA